MLDVQKAGMWKRISAALFDFILLGILAVAVAFLISLAVDYDGHTAKLETLSDSYEAAYGVDFDITLEEYEALTPEARANFDAGYAAFAADVEANRLYNLIFQFTLLILISACSVPSWCWSSWCRCSSATVRRWVKRSSASA